MEKSSFGDETERVSVKGEGVDVAVHEWMLEIRACIESLAKANEV